MRRTTLIIALFLILTVDGKLTPQVSKKVALVIGNGLYQNITTLSNPANDANDMSSILNKLGFDVIAYVDASYIQMDDAILEFSRKLVGAEVGLLYYAGHGVQSNGINYLIPVDANIREEFQLKQKTIDASYYLDAMNAAGASLNLVILDACRNNPWEKSGRSIGEGRGLAELKNSPRGTIIAYATDPGRTAKDGKGRNGTFTKSLLKYIATPGLEVKEMLDRVGAEVSEETHGIQNPWVSSKFYSKYYLGGILGPDVGNQHMSLLDQYEYEKAIREKQLPDAQRKQNRNKNLGRIGIGFGIGSSIACIITYMVGQKAFNAYSQSTDDETEKKYVDQVTQQRWLFGTSAVITAFSFILSPSLLHDTSVDKVQKEIDVLDIQIKKLRDQVM